MVEEQHSLRVDDQEEEKKIAQVTEEEKLMDEILEQEAVSPLLLNH